MFREINVPKEELEECQRTIIADLVHPRQTILDESLGSALWFAAQGHGENSMSSSRVRLGSIQKRVFMYYYFVNFRATSVLIQRHFFYRYYY